MAKKFFNDSLKFIYKYEKIGELVFLLAVLTLATLIYTIKIENVFVRFSINDQMVKGIVAEGILFEQRIVTSEYFHPSEINKHGSYFFYILATFYSLFGVSVLSSKVCLIAFNLLFILFIYLFNRTLFGKGVAAIAMFLSVFSIFFIYQAYALGNWSVLPFFQIFSFYLFTKYYKTQNRRVLYTSFLVLGLGTYTHSLGFYMLFPLVLMTLLFKRIRPRKLDYLLYALLFILPFLPMFIRGFLFDEPTIVPSFLHNIFETEDYNIKNTNFFENLKTNLDLRRITLEGGSGELQGSFLFNYLFPISFLPALLVIAMSRSFEKGIVLFFLGVLLFQMSFTLSDIREHHSVIVLPFFLSTIASFYWTLSEKNKMFAIFVTILLLMFANEFLEHLQVQVNNHFLNIDGIRELIDITSASQVSFQSHHLSSIYAFLDNETNKQLSSMSAFASDRLNDVYAEEITSGKEYFLFEVKEAYEPVPATPEAHLNAFLEVTEEMNKSAELWFNKENPTYPFQIYRIVQN